MPTYEYACRDCGEHIEVVQSFKDDPLTTCGICGGALRKVFSAAGIIFKGSGYYVTDSRKSSTAPSADKPADAASKPAASKPDSSSAGEKKAESA
ncbi:MAG TPA: FmdB family zinc ribbon protein [Egibacteraceae bacterium]|nr:FmdB family zinc ribbon protein [Egibacteraceae bacterium]